MGIVARGGKLLACTNHRGIGQSRFRRMLFEGARAAKRATVQVRDLPPPADYPVAAGDAPNTKSVLVTLV
jgi:23S rRNA (cytosine1962-C5)-methyltransferase